MICSHEQHDPRVHTCNLCAPSTFEDGTASVRDLCLAQETAINVFTKAQNHAESSSLFSIMLCIFLNTLAVSRAIQRHVWLACTAYLTCSDLDADVAAHTGWQCDVISSRTTYESIFSELTLGSACFFQGRHVDSTPLSTRQSLRHIPPTQPLPSTHTQAPTLRAPAPHTQRHTTTHY